MTTATTADELLDDLKTLAQVGDTDGRFGSTAAAVDLALFRILDRVIRTKLGVAVYKAADGRWVKPYDVTLVVDQADYGLPARCFAGGIEQVSLVNSAGAEVFLDYVEWEDLDDYDNIGFWPTPKYTTLDDAVRLLPAPKDTQYTMRVRCVRRPSKLVAVAEAQLTTSITSTTMVGTIPSTFDASPTTVDVVRSDHHGTPLEDSIAVTYSGTTITRSSGTNETTASQPLVVVAGDYVCMEGETCIPQVPEVAMQYVLEEAACICARVMGDAQAYTIHKDAVKDLKKDLMSAIAKRVGKSAKAINRDSPLRFAGSGRRRRSFRWRG